MGISSEKATSNLKLVAITWPIFVELFLQTIMGSTDTIMLSRISDNAVAAVGVANQLVFFCILIFNFISSGTAVVLSQYLGAGLYKEAKSVTAISITINLIIGLIISLIMIVFEKQFLGLFNLSKELSVLGEQYLFIVGGTLFIQALLQTASTILRVNGFTRDAMFVSIFMNVVHLIFNSIFIFGLLGVPSMGVSGPGFSTAISRTLALIVIFRLIYTRISINLKLKDYLKIELTHIKKILKVGIPAAGEQVSYNTSQLAITAFIAILGSVALTTRVYTQNIMSYIMLFGVAMGQGTQILVGHKVGAGDFDGAYRQLLKSLKYSFVITILVAILMASIGGYLLVIFTDRAAEPRS